MERKEILDLIHKTRDDGTTSLSLYGQQLTEFPAGICTLTNLTTLKLGWNTITAIPPEICRLTNLTDLYLGGNRIETIPPEIGNLKNLTVLELGNNRIETIPPEIGNLDKLTALYLNNNRIETIPPEIGNLKRLTGLHLSYNRIRTLPPEIGGLTKLIGLDLSKNELTALPPEIGNLTNLNRLYLPQNRLAELPAEICHLTDLVTIELYGNPLANIPPESAKAGGKAVVAYLSSLMDIRRERIVVVLRNDIWGQFFPIERALSQTLAGQYTVEKSAGRIVVRLESAGQLHGALDAVVPLLAALEDAVPDEIVSVGVEQGDRPAERIEGETLKAYLGEISGTLDERLNEKDKLAATEETGVVPAQGVPPAGKVLAAWRQEQAPGRHTLMRDIYRPFKRFFAAAKDLP